MQWREVRDEPVSRRTAVNVLLWGYTAKPSEIRKVPGETFCVPPGVQTFLGVVTATLPKLNGLVAYQATTLISRGCLHLTPEVAGDHVKFLVVTDGNGPARRLIRRGLSAFCLRPIGGRRSRGQRNRRGAHAMTAWAHAIRPKRKLAVPTNLRCSRHV